MKIKVFTKTYLGGGADIYLYQETEGKYKPGRYVAKPIDLTMTLLEEGQRVEPTFTMPEYELAEFLKSMAELAEEKGIKTDKQLQEETKTKGVLEATKFHLEDMRSLVFKK